MALAMLLRIVSGLPAVSAPHLHGDTLHTHGAGGIAHHHPESAFGPDPHAAGAHRHVDGQYHVHANGAPARGDVAANHFPVRIPVRWPPERPLEPAEESSPSHPPAPEDVPAGQGDTYYCAAATAALLQDAAAAPWLPDAVEADQPRYVGTARPAQFTPRQSRAPPGPSPAAKA